MGAVQHPECERARLWVSLSLDGELSEIERMSLRAHVRRCAACAAFEGDVGALTMELRNAPLVSPATADADGPAIPVALPRRRSKAVRVLQVGAAAAAVVLAAGLGSLAGSLSSGGTPTATTVARTVAGNLGARLDPAIAAMVPAQKLPASRTRTPVAI